MTLVLLPPLQAKAVKMQLCGCIIHGNNVITKILWTRELVVKTVVALNRDIVSELELKNVNTG